MFTMNGVVNENELKDYMSKHNIQSIMTSLMESLLRTRPEDPLQGIADVLYAEYGILASGSGRPPAQNKNKADENKDEEPDSDTSSDSGSSSDSSSTSEDELPAQPRRLLVRRQSAGRRASVSAWVMNPTDEFVAPVYKKTQEETEDITKCLANNPLFSTLDESARNTIILAMGKCQYDSDVEVITQGDLEAENFYLIANGTAEAYVNGNLVKSYKANEGFGELALLYCQPRAATVKTTSKSTFWTLDQQTFKHIIVGGVIGARQQYVEFLSKCPLLKDLKEFEIMTLADSLRKVHYFKGDMIIQQGDLGHDFYIVKEGLVHCVKDDVVVSEVGVGEYFGEIALLYNKPRQASVIVASDDVTVLAIDRDTFQRVLGPLAEILRRNGSAIVDPDSEISHH